MLLEEAREQGVDPAVVVSEDEGFLLLVAFGFAPSQADVQAILGDVHPREKPRRTRCGVQELLLLLCCWRPFLADTGSPRLLRTKWPRQLFGLSLLVLNGKGATTKRLLRGLVDGPGPRSVCRAHPADFTTANKIQGPRLLLAPALRYGCCSVLCALPLHFEQPLYLLCEGVACHILHPRGEHRPVGYSPP